MRNNNNCPNTNFNCTPLPSSQCCLTQTTPINSTQLAQLINILNGLINAIHALLSNPTDANKQALIALFNQFLDLLNSLTHSPESNFLKQLIQSILNLLQSSNPDLGQLQSLLQQFYSALSTFFFSVIVDPATLQLLLNLLTQLIGATPGTGSTGATGTFVGVQPFDPANAPTYLPGQVVFFNGSSYVVNVPNPQGTPGFSPDYTLIASGVTGPTGATGVDG
ncbi:hypothetical protein II5_05987, partial [Bacillus cereus MSX-A1]|uniref:collagen-like repeat preface domain-containing protein n=1 Tax=Bacillus cereus TaxID=1396 RepID=UPI0002797C73